MDNTEVFLIHSATVNMSSVSNGDSEGIGIDANTNQQLEAMSILVEGMTHAVIITSSPRPF